LNAAAAKGVQIYGLSSQLPECYLQDASGWLICGDKEAYVLKLSPEQAQEARGLLALSQSQAYLRDRDLASLQKHFPAAEYLLPEAKDWERIGGQWPVDKAKDLGRVTARSLEDLTRSELRWEADDQKLRCPELAMAARYTWEVMPPGAPTAPAAASEAEAAARRTAEVDWGPAPGRVMSGKRGAVRRGPGTGPRRVKKVRTCSWSGRNRPPRS
jgi:hypothetical protein